MTRFDRYMLSQLLLFFGFFALVLVALFWITRAVRLFDRLIGDGQSVLIFAEFSALALPGLVLVILPLASFGAAVHVSNRLLNESELTVMLATGSSPWRLARPVAVFAVFVFLMMSILAHVLVPMAKETLDAREREISRDMTASLLVPGRFLHPTDGLTLYTREIGSDGVLRGVFLSDQRDPETEVIYTSSNAYLVREGEIASLIMIDGLVQRLSSENRRLATTIFSDVSFDINGLISSDAPLSPRIVSLGSWTMISQWSQLPELTNSRLGVVVQAFHARFADALLAAATAMMGFSVLMSVRFSRTGPWKEIMAAFGVLLLLDGLRATLVEPVRDAPDLWPVIYLPFSIASLIALALLTLAARPFRRVREVTS